MKVGAALAQSRLSLQGTITLGYRTATAIIVFLWLNNTTSVASVLHEVIAATGQTVPSGGSYATFSNWYPAPEINNDGKVAFHATLADGAGSSGVFLGDGTNTALIALQGAATPAGGVFGQLFDFQLNARGQVAFSSDQDFNNVGATRGIFLHDGSTIMTVAHGESPGGGSYSYFDQVELNDSGQVAFSAGAYFGASPFDRRGVFFYDGHSVSSIAVEQTPAPAGGNYLQMTSFPILGEGGEMTFTATLAGGSSSSGLFFYDGSSTTAIALQGTPAPTGGTYGFISGTNDDQVDPSGRVVYYGSVNGGPSGIFRYDDGATVPMALEGAAAPAGGNHDFLGVGHHVNSSGEVAYLSRLRGGTSGEGIFRTDGVTSTPIALRGMTAPGTDARFLDFITDNFRMNDDGTVVVWGRLETGFISAGSGYWYGKSTDDLQLLVREGDPIVVDGTARILDEISVISNFSISDSAIAWVASFTDGTQAVLRSTFSSSAAAANGDFDGDGLVNQADLTIWAAGFGLTNANLSQGDSNGDGVVDGNDFLNWQRRLTPTPASPVAEPSSCVALCTCMAAVMGYRRHTRLRRHRRGLFRPCWTADGQSRRSLGQPRCSTHLNPA